MSVGSESEFDEAFDLVLSSIQYEEEPCAKRLKPYCEEDSSDDDFLFKAADELENSIRVTESDDDGFKTRIGRPHPLLLPEVLENVMKYVFDGKTLSNCRLVSTAWYDAATVHWPTYNEIKNVSHVIEKYPYGLSYSSVTKDFETEYRFPGIVNLKIADPCLVFTKPIVDCYFQTHGNVLKSFSFDANFGCMEHLKLVVHVVFKWCNNLEDLKLIDVCNRTVLTTDSMHPLTIGNKKIRLKNLTVNAIPYTILDHHHFSTCSKITPSYEFLVSQGLRNDGGLLGRIVRACETLESIDITSNWNSPTNLLDSGVVPNCRKITINGGVINRFDINRLKRVHLIELKIGPVRNEAIRFRNLLSHQSNNLETLELYGDGNPDVMDIRLPTMSVLNKLVIHDGLKIRIRSLGFMSRMVKLKVLEIHSEATDEASTVMLLNVLKRLEHYTLFTLNLMGRCCYANTNVSAWFPNLKSLTITVLGENKFILALNNITQLTRLTSLTIRFTACNVRLIAEHTLEFLPQIKTLKHVTLHFMGFNNLVPFTLQHFNSIVMDSSLRTLHLINYAIYEDEGESLLKNLSEHLLMTTFENCKIKPRRILKKNCSIVTLDYVRLCKFTLKSVIKSYFQP
ncbi:unnamed protein product [Orchesella dallaii]|uniref:F-box domain-containing protein n=1 Tax=Orchesella dallaii TaxID=48710 RepID=A0ABP1R1V7_9HEXA